MPTLIVRKPDGGEDTYELVDEVTVGREAGVDMVLPDAGVSRKHARFFVEGGDVLVEDLGSSNGVFVDGEKIGGPTAVPPGSPVMIGDFEITLREDGTVPRAQRPTARAPKVTPAGRAPPSSAKAAPRASTGSRAPLKAADVKGKLPTPERSSSRPLPAAAKAAGGANLRGTSGPWAGQIFPLDKAKVSVGRTGANDVVLDDDSVSRHHGELVQAAGGGFKVRDLGSANGTFVNGAAVEEHPLKPGDLIRFGVVEVAYSGPASKEKAPAAAGSAGGPRKKLLIAAVALVGLFVVLGAVKKVMTPPEPPPEAAEGAAEAPSATEEGAKREEAIVRAKIRMKGFLEQNEWDKASKEADQLLELDPINVEARRVQRVAKRESEFKKTYDEGKTKASLGQDEEALERYFQIPKDSEYYKRTRGEVRKVALETLAPKYRGDCLGYYNSNRFKEAKLKCARFLDFTCHEKIDEKSLKFLRYSESKSKEKDDKEWQCPGELRHWFVEEENVAVAQIREQIRKQYPEEEIAEAMTIYALEGKSKLVMDQLKKLRVDSKFAKSHALIDTLTEKLQIIDGKFSDGQTHFLQDNIKGADVEWRIALEKDKELLPAGVSSVLARQIRQNLAQGWYKAGVEYTKRNQLRLAFECWNKGFEANQSNLDIRNGMQRLETEADNILSSAPNCNQIKDALGMTREGSAANKRAQGMWKERGCK